MSEHKADYRTAVAMHEVHKTSLSDFILKPEAITDDSDPTPTDAQPTDGESSEVQETTSETTGEDNVSEENKEAEVHEEAYEVKGQKVPLKDLLNAYETRQEISRRFDELGKREKKVLADREKARKERAEVDFINEKFEEMRQQVLEGNSLGALHIAMTMAQAGEENPDNKGMQELIKQAVTIADNFASMSEEEQQLFLRKEELAQRERKLERENKRLAKIKAEEELQRHYDAVLTANNVTEPELDATFEEINRIPQFKEQLEAKTDPVERINYCVSWVLGKRLNARVVEGITKVDTDLAKDDKFRLALLDYIEPEYTVDEIARLVRAYKGEPSDSAKVESAASTQSVAPKKPTTSNRAPTDKTKAEKTVPITSFKDLIAKYSN